MTGVLQAITDWSNRLVGSSLHVYFRCEDISSVVGISIFKSALKSCMLTAALCLRLIWLRQKCLLCVVCSSDFSFCVSACQLVLVCPRYCKLPTSNADADVYDL